MCDLQKHLYLVCILLCTFFNNDLYSQNSVSGEIWLDRDEDGFYESSDSPLGNNVVNLFGDDGNLFAFTFSNSDGFYEFLNLPDGTYHLTFAQIDGLKALIPESPLTESDIDQNLQTLDFTLDNTNSDLTINAGYVSAIIINVPNQISVCYGDEAVINANVMGSSGPLTYQWDNNPGNNTGTNIFTISDDINVTVTVLDSWNIPMTRRIEIRMLDGLSVSSCLRHDNFGSITEELVLDVSSTAPGPFVNSDLDFPGLFGGQRDIKFELLSGNSISTLNIVNSALYISNCVDCKTVTEICYVYPDDALLSFSLYNYLELISVNIDQGRTQVTVSISDGTNSASKVNVFEQEGINSGFDFRIDYENFDNIDNVDLENVKSICYDMVTLSHGSDLTITELVSCTDLDCEITPPDSIEICLGDSTVLSVESSCGDDGLLFQWDGLGIGNNQLVSPDVNTTYDLTVWDQSGCNKIFSIDVIVNDIPEIELLGDTDVCEGEENTYSVNHLSGTAPYSYSWNVSSNTTSEISLIITQDTTVSVTVTDANGCTINEAINITALPLPEIILTSNPSDCAMSTGSVISSVSGGAMPYTYLWSNGESTVDLQNVPQGTYTLSITDVNGCEGTTSVVVNNKPCAEIGNFIWKDENYNGIQDSLEIPIEGMIIYLIQNGAIIDQDTSDIMGLYLFDNLEPGDYQIQFGELDDYVATQHTQGQDSEIDSDVDPATSMSSIITIQEFEKNHTVDGGFYIPGSKGDMVWNDSNNNGVKDNNEAGMEGVEVVLLDCDDVALDTMFTDVDGNFMFADLVPGGYKLKFSDTSGFKFTEQFVGDSNMDSNADEITGYTDCVEVHCGDNITNCDAGLVELAQIGDLVWHDLNGDGLQDLGEEGIEGVTIQLYDCNDSLISETVTDSDGIYEFVDVVPGDYYLSTDTNGVYEISPLNVGNSDEVDSDFDTNGRTSCTTLLPGEIDLTFDLGVFIFSCLGDYVWHDSNLDGIQNEQSDSIMSGFMVWLYDCDGNTLDSIVTDDEGLFLFCDLVPGEYMIGTQLSTSMKYTDVNSGDETLDSDIDPISELSDCVEIESGDHNTDTDIGVVFLSKIGDFIWEDEDGDGIQDATEVGVPDVVINLYNCLGDSITSIVTDEEGRWCAEDLPYGEYEIVLEVPEPYSGTVSFNGNDIDDSNLNPETNIIECFDVNVPKDTTLDVGLVNCSVLNGIAWLDVASNNNIQDPIENGINGIQVSLFRKNGNEWEFHESTYTTHVGDASGIDGYYEFCASPGEYYVQFANISSIIAVVPYQGPVNIDSDVTHQFGINTTDVINMQSGVNMDDISIGYKFANASLKNGTPNPLLIFSSEVVSDLDFTVFPNPSLDKVYVKVQNSRVKPKVSQIINSSGDKVKYSEQIKRKQDGEYLITITTDAKGFHFIVLLIGDKKKTLSFIKM